MIHKSMQTNDKRFSFDIKQRGWDIMNATARILSGLTLALALTLALGTMGMAREWNGSDYENGVIPEAAIGVRLPAGFHLQAVANGSDFENHTIVLPEGAKGGRLLVEQSLADRGERLGPVIGSDYENGR